VTRHAAGQLPQRDAEIVALCRQGAEAGFSALLGAHHSYVLRICWRILGQREEALDVTQEVFIRAVSAMSRLDPQPSLRPWLRRVAINLSLDAARRTERVELHGEVPALDALGCAGAGRGDAEGLGDPVGKAVAARAELADIEACIQRLRPELRTVLLLRVVEGLSHQEIAGILECPVGTVKSHLSRAREQLRRMAAGPRPVMTHD